MIGDFRVAAGHSVGCVSANWPHLRFGYEGTTHAGAHRSRLPPSSQRARTVGRTARRPPAPGPAVDHAQAVVGAPVVVRRQRSRSRLGRALDPVREARRGVAIGVAKQIDGRADRTGARSSSQFDVVHADTRSAGTIDDSTQPAASAAANRREPRGRRRRAADHSAARSWSRASAADSGASVAGPNTCGSPWPWAAETVRGCRPRAARRRPAARPESEPETLAPVDSPAGPYAAVATAWRSRTVGRQTGPAHTDSAPSYRAGRRARPILGGRRDGRRLERRRRSRDRATATLMRRWSQGGSAVGGAAASAVSRLAVRCTGAW